jgi:hypothetical protein
MGFIHFFVNLVRIKEKSSTPLSEYLGITLNNASTETTQTSYVRHSDWVYQICYHIISFIVSESICN